MIVLVNEELEEEMKDAVGQELEVGCRVAHIARFRSRVFITERRVTGISDNQVRITPNNRWGSPGNLVRLGPEPTAEDL